MKKAITKSAIQFFYLCNYGWGGNCNGYYQSGIFDTRNGAIYVRPDKGDKLYHDEQYDVDVPTSSSKYYRRDKSIIFYNL